MADAALQWASTGANCWFIVPDPTQVRVHSRQRPTLIDLLREAEWGVSFRLATVPVGRLFEFGTASYRANVYAHLLARDVPAGVPVIVSDDSAVWAGATALAKRHPIIGVLHADEEKYYSLAKMNASRVAALVGVSHRISNKIASLIPESRAAIATIPCGIPIAAAEIADNSDTDGTLRLTWVGRIQESQKRISDIPKIAALVGKSGVPVRLSIVGDGPDRDLLAASVSAAGLSSSTDFLGWLPKPEVTRVLRRSDILVLPSNFEGMPLSVMEALAVGCAIVASRTSGIEDYTRHPLAEGCLWTHAVGDVGEAAQCVKKAHDVPHAIRRARARRFAASEFSIERNVQAYRNLISELPPPDMRAEAGSRFRHAATAAASVPVATWRSARLTIQHMIK